MARLPIENLNPSVKDAKGIYGKAEVAAAPPLPELGPMPDADAASLLHKSMEILRREVVSLYLLSASGKLNEKAARDLSSYIKLLHDLAKSERDVLDEMTDEDLELEIARRNKE